MSADDFAFGFIGGLFFGILLKTGTDASMLGITTKILNALRPVATGVVVWLIPLFILIFTAGFAIMAIQRFKENPAPVGIGFILGLGITFL